MKRNLYLLLAVLMLAAVFTASGRNTVSVAETPETEEPAEPVVIFENDNIRLSVSGLTPDGKDASFVLENVNGEQPCKVERTSGSQWLGGDLLVNGIPVNTEHNEHYLLAGDSVSMIFGIRESDLTDAGIDRITDVEFMLALHLGTKEEDGTISYPYKPTEETKVLHVAFGEDGKVASFEQKEETFPEHTVLIETEIFRLSVIHDAATHQDVCFLAENFDPGRDIETLCYPGETPDGWTTAFSVDGNTVTGKSDIWANAGKTVLWHAEIGTDRFPAQEMRFCAAVLYGRPGMDGDIPIQSFNPNEPDYVTEMIRIDFDENGNIKAVVTGEAALQPAEPEKEELTQEEKDFYEALRLYYEELDYKGAYKLLKPYKNPTIGAMAAFMGDCNYLGKGTGENNNEAYRLYSLAADLGCGLGYYGKGMCTNFGYGVKKDQDAAKELFRTALELLPGEIESFTDPHLKGLAAFYLGRIHYYGLADGFRDSREAMPYLEQAAEYHNPEALGLLGEYSYNNRSKEEALQYYTEAADYGNAGGAYNAGMMYLDGVGTEKNGELAVKYLQLAVDYGFSQARSDLNAAKKLQKEQANGNG